MEGEMRVKHLLACFFFAGLVSLSPVASRSLEALNNQKTYYSPDPHPVGHTPSPHHSHKKPVCTPPPTSNGNHYGSSGAPTPPYGSSGSYGTPSTPSYTTPSAPSQGSGGYYGTPAVVPPPASTTPVVEPPVISTPITPVISTPITPVISAPVIPVGPSTPIIPGISTPSSPLVPVDPHVPFFTPGTCYYWSTHPKSIWAILGYFGTVGEYFGPGCILAFGKNPSLQEALTNTRTDGIGALYREGTAALLNSMVCTKYTLTTPEVTHAFAMAVASDKAAAVQAEMFKKLNEGNVIKA